jgi:hypothetical protein
MTVSKACVAAEWSALISTSVSKASNGGGQFWNDQSNKALLFYVSYVYLNNNIYQLYNSEIKWVPNTKYVVKKEE